MDMSTFVENFTDQASKIMPIAVAGVADLQKALPKCRIDWDGKKDK